MGTPIKNTPELRSFIGELNVVHQFYMVCFKIKTNFNSEFKSTLAMTAEGLNYGIPLK